MHLFVDGNYLFHLSKQLGVPQNFSALEERIAEAVNSPDVVSRWFYTRPPAETNSKPVVGWLRAHDWNVSVFNYMHTHQDSMYVHMVSDLYTVMEQSPNTPLAIVSGSGALTYPLTHFPDKGNVFVFTTEASVNRRLRQLDGINFMNLEEYLQ